MGQGVDQPRLGPVGFTKTGPELPHWRNRDVEVAEKSLTACAVTFRPPSVVLPALAIALS